MKKNLILVVFSFVSNLVIAGRLLIIFDDVGYRNTDLGIYAMPKEVSVSIIPSAPHAVARSTKAGKQDRDVLIHMPMEPISVVPLEPEVIRTHMSYNTINSLVEYAIKRVPNAIAMNNHMGSKATADPNTMNNLMSIIARHNLMFVDSETSGNSIAYKTALKQKLKALQRNVFLDNSLDYKNIQKQWNLALNHAKHHKLTVIIGHPHLETIAVVSKGIKNLTPDIELTNLSTYLQLNKSEAKKGKVLEQDVNSVNIIELLNNLQTKSNTAQQETMLKNMNLLTTDFVKIHILLMKFPYIL